MAKELLSQRQNHGSICKQQAIILLKGTLSIDFFFNFCFVFCMRMCTLICTIVRESFGLFFSEQERSLLPSRILNYILELGLKSLSEPYL